jgi:flavin-dependent dehydrogenase
MAVSGQIAEHYDVIIMGGGPAGSTLGAQLARTSDLSVAIFEKVKFPRAHIGESLAHPATTALEEIGALQKVMDAGFSVKKFGGIFHWDGNAPTAGFFDHASWEEDGAYRFAYHVNREELDETLLRHAEELGVHVFEEAPVSAFKPEGDGCVVTLSDGRKVHGKYFVDASGRRNSITSPQKRAHLSSYKNLALWQHFTGCKSGYEIEADWNVFQEGKRSPIVCSAFEDGWAWFIPVVKVIDGKRVPTHSIGIVTLPEVLKQPGKDFTDPAVFQEAIKRIPLVQDLIENAQPVSDTVSTATNYSMVNGDFNNFDERWILVGDSAYFVDPLFSSGVAFAMHHALSAALLIRTALDPALSEQAKRDVWNDYNVGWHAIAEVYSLSIDQWYHAIGALFPDSVYWGSRGNTMDMGLREQTFQILLSTAMTPDILRLLTRNSNKQEDLDQSGPYMQALSQAGTDDLAEGDVLRRAEGAEIRESLTIDLPGFKGALPPLDYEVPAEFRDAVVQYWADPVANGGVLEHPFNAAKPCHRFSGPGGELRSFADQDGGITIWNALGETGRLFGDLSAELTETQVFFLKLMIRSGLVSVEKTAEVKEPVGSVNSHMVGVADA